ncbi:MAG: leucyl aminopeptidase [Actinomycetales bacterium]
MPTISLTGKPASGVSADALVVGVRKVSQGAPALVSTELPTPVAKALAAAVTALGLTGAATETAKIPAPAGVSATTVLLVGLGEDPGPEDLRRAAGLALRTLGSSPRVAVAVATSTPADVGAVAEGALLGAYTYTRYRSSTSSDSGARPARGRRASASGSSTESIQLLTTGHREAATKAAFARAQVVAEAVNATRDLVNCPPNDLYPAAFAQIATELGAAHGFSVTVTDEKALRSGGYGGLTAVGPGSSRPPRLVRLEYTPPTGRGRAKKADLGHIALVGKGITFDSGGLSLKPGDAMKTMKLDMAGAAAVLHTVVAAARLQVPIKVTAWLCLAENMPSGTAQRPSDVITILGGKTVEVLNTDAEGRLVLADGLVSASAEGPDAIIDIATLTGAQMVALGNRVSAVMANNDDLRAQVVAAADGSGEQFWPMPLPPELRAGLDSPVADIANIGDRMGGMLSAGLFLAEFVGTDDSGTKIPWAHLDIAGPSFNESGPHGYTPKGGTGVGVRTMLSLLEARAGV